MRDLDKTNNNNNDTQKDNTATESIWRRENDIRSELERTRDELERATEHMLEIETKCDGFESHAITAEKRYRDAVRTLREMKESHQITSEQLDILKKAAARYDHDLKIDTHFQQQQVPLSAVFSGGNESTKPQDQVFDSPSPPTTRETLVSRILEGKEIPRKKKDRNLIINCAVLEYSNDTDIETFVRDCAVASHRNVDKAIEWANKLKDQDIMTVGDLRDLHDEDWAGIGLTVFALRALKNMLKGKRQSASTTTSTNGTPTNSAPNSARVSPPL